MFNDRFGLTQSVLEGRKTMTRRIIPNVSGIRKSPFVKSGWEDIHGYELKPKYQIGEVVAIAMSYEYIFYELQCGLPDECSIGAGWKNKMFVKAEYMPYKIKITNVVAELLQGVSDDDCLKEGIYRLNSANGNGGIVYSFVGACDKKHIGLYDNPREAFSVLINKLSDKGTWGSNPYVWVYEFELVK